MKSIYRITTKVLFTAALIFVLSSINTIVASDSPLSSYMNEEIMEETLSVENWMVNLNDWSIKNFEEDSFIEEEVNLENWMLSADESNWNSLIQVEKEDEVEVENWMTDISKW